MAGKTNYSIGVNETPVQYLDRMLSEGTTAGTKAAAEYLAASNTEAELEGFRAQVARTYNVGRVAVAHATLVNSAAPKAFTDVAKACDVKEGSDVKFAGKAYSTLRECYRVFTLHTAEETDAFITCWTAVEGQPPRNVRDLLTWLERIAKNDNSDILENNEAAYRKAKQARETAAATAAATTKDGKARTKTLYGLGYVPEVADRIGQTTWATFTSAELLDIARLAGVLALTADARHEAAAKAAADEAAAREAAAKAGGETGPKVKRQRKVSV